MSGVKKKKKKQEEQNVSKEVHKRTQVKEPKWNGEAKWQYFITFVCTTTKRMREIAVPSPSPTLLPTSRPPPPLSSNNLSGKFVHQGQLYII